jgi:hypothetical protein
MVPSCPCVLPPSVHPCAFLRVKSIPLLVVVFRIISITNKATKQICEVLATSVLLTIESVVSDTHREY